MTTSIREVARHAGVSVGTVSNVLNRPDAVADRTRRRVLDAIAELGFVRNESARQLRAGTSRTIGLVVLDIANPFFTDVAHGVETMAEDVGSTVMLCNSGEDSERERRHLETLVEQRVQGVLITPVDTERAQLEQLLERDIPVVLVDRGAGGRRLCSVAVDDEFGGRLALDHLLAQGHEHIAFVGGPLAIPQVAERLRGAEAAVSEASIDATLVTIPTSSLQVGEGHHAGERIVDMPAVERPTAVFCANDLLAMGVLRAMVQHGLRVPEDVAIVGYDDIDYAAAAAVPLSSVQQPREEIGRTAARLLLEELDDRQRHRHQQVVFEPELVVRASSDHERS